METSTGRSASASAPACMLSVFDEPQRRRHDELQRRLSAAIAERRELGDGYAFRISAEPATFVEVAEWITLERLCCPFLAFRMEWTGRETWLSLTGGTGVKEMLAAAIAAPR